MALGPRLDLRQSQSLVMTPQLRQAIQLLQFSNIEVNAFVEQELERNPMLERDERIDDVAALERPAPDQRTLVNAQGEPLAPDPVRAAGGEIAHDSAAAEADHRNSYDPGTGSDGAGRGSGGSFEYNDGTVEDYVAGKISLREHLGEQVRLSFAAAADRLVASSLIAWLEPSGRLGASLDDIARALGMELSRVEAVHARMMRLDPVGILARDLRECLAVQLAELNRLDPAMATLLDHLDLLAARDMRRLQGLCGVDGSDLADMLLELRRLDPKPGASFDAAPIQPLIPDVLMRAVPGGDWLLELNPETMPRVLINHSFSVRLPRHASREDKVFMSDKLQTANWLVKSLQQRAQTILKVAGEIVRQQDGFFRGGVGHLRPLILRDIADAVELHESTVSRVTAGKYIATPRGTFELKYFFTTAIAGTSGETHSAEAVRWRIRAMVAAETPVDILSDDAIVAVLRREGVDIARRTVAKYRDALRIPSSVQRKREKAMSA